MRHALTLSVRLPLPGALHGWRSGVETLGLLPLLCSIMEVIGLRTPARRLPAEPLLQGLRNAALGPWHYLLFATIIRV